MVRVSEFQLNEAQATLILTVAAIGLGDIWRLPALALNHGGGAFLLTYAGALALLGVPILMAEMAFGKLGGQRFSVATRAAVSSLRLPRLWLVTVWSLPIAGVAVIALYGALAGWSFGYIFRAASGAAQHLDQAGARALFLELAADPERSMVWHTLFWLCVGVASAQGWRHGIVRMALWFGGLMLVLLMFLADGIPVQAKYAEGVQRMFSFRWEELGTVGLWAALTQACFTLSLGLGIVYVVGRRLRLGAHTARIALSVVALDLAFGLIIGAAIATVVGNGAAVNSGVTLVFIDLVVGLGGSKATQVQFFSLLVLLSASSAILLIEPFVQTVIERFRTTRVAASAVVTMLAWLVGLIAIFSFGPWRDWQFYGRGVVDWLVYIGVDILVPLNCLILASFVGRALPPSLVVAASASRLAVMGPWYLWLRFPVRLLLVLLLLQTSGIMDAVWNFFQPVEVRS